MATGTGDSISFWPLACADGHRQLLGCCSAGARAKQVWKKGTPCFQELGSDSQQQVQAEVSEELLLHTIPSLDVAARQERSRVRSSLGYPLPEGLQDLLFFSVLAAAAREARHRHSRAGKQQNAGVWPERQRLVLERYSATWLHRLVEMPRLGVPVWCVHTPAARCESLQLGKQSPQIFLTL